MNENILPSVVWTSLTVTDRRLLFDGEGQLETIETLYWT